MICQISNICSRPLNFNRGICFMEIWPKLPLFNIFRKSLIFFTNSNRIEAIAQNCAQTKCPTIKMHNTNFEVHGLRTNLHLSILTSLEFQKVCLKNRQTGQKSNKTVTKTQNIGQKSQKWPKTTMKHLKYAPNGPPWLMSPRGPSQMLVIYPKIGQKEPKRSKAAKYGQKKEGDFVHQNSPERIFFLPFLPSILLARLRGLF